MNVFSNVCTYNFTDASKGGAHDMAAYWTNPSLH
jgi:hypothetical protein